MAQGNGERAELDQFLAQFGAELATAEQELSQVRDRYEQVTRDRRRQQELHHQIEVVRPERDRAKIQAQRQHLTEKLQTLER